MCLCRGRWVTSSRLDERVLIKLSGVSRTIISEAKLAWFRNGFLGQVSLKDPKHSITQRVSDVSIHGQVVVK